MIKLFDHNISEKGIEKCAQVIRSGWHTSGEIGDQIENNINRYYEWRNNVQYYTALTNSCSVGLIALALAWGIEAGDEFITTPMTFIASAAAFMSRGARPIFVDIDPKTGLMDIDQVEAAITPKTRAIVAVNLYGHMLDTKRLGRIASKHHLLLVEDCAHAFDSQRSGFLPGRYSDAVVCSFYASKNTHCGEGGAVISRNQELIQKIKTIRRHGLSKYPKPGDPGNMGYDVAVIGFKGILSDIAASLLLEQIEYIEFRGWAPDLFRSQRNLIARRYLQAFESLEHINPILPEGNVRSSWYTFPLLVTNRDSLRQKLASLKIGHTVMYPSLETFTLFGSKITCPLAYKFGEQQLSIPCHPKLTETEVSLIIESIVNWNNSL